MFAPLNASGQKTRRDWCHVTWKFLSEKAKDVFVDAARTALPDGALEGKAHSEVALFQRARSIWHDHGYPQEVEQVERRGQRGKY